jgi:hypothetical protein
MVTNGRRGNAVGDEAVGEGFEHRDVEDGVDILECLRESKGNQKGVYVVQHLVRAQVLVSECERVT